MGEKQKLLEKADHLAGITALILFILGFLQVLLGEFFLKSVALTANGFDCIGDGFVSAVVWVGLKVFRRPADHKFHYGYYKMENLASIGAAVVMMILAGYIVFRSYNQFIDPHKVQLPLVGAGIALLAAVIALGLGVYKYKRGKKSKMSSVRLDAFNTIKDGIASGLTVVALLLAPVFPQSDAIVGFIIAGIIVSIGFAAIKESSYMLVDACDGECIDKSYIIKKIAEKTEGVKAAHNISLRRSGPVMQGELELEVSCDMTVREFNKIKNSVVKQVKDRFPDIERLTVSAKTVETEGD